MAEINNMASTQTTYCKYCGKEIDSDSRYCRYCGKTQDKSKSFIESLKKLLRGFLKLVLVAAICYGFGLIIYYCIGKDAVEETPLGAWGFILPQFLAYLFYKILSFAYPLNGKKKTILATFLAVLTIALIGVEVYTALSKTEQEKQEYDPQQSTINRIFLGCSFGDSYSHVEETLKAKKISPQSKLGVGDFYGLAAICHVECHFRRGTKGGTDTSLYIAQNSSPAQIMTPVMSRSIRQ